MTNASRPAVLATSCTAGSCPTVYQASPGEVLVQGYQSEHEHVDLPAGEALVRVPDAVLIDAVEKLLGQPRFVDLVTKSRMSLVRNRRRKFK